jgi:hypothetical protein
MPAYSDVDRPAFNYTPSSDIPMNGSNFPTSVNPFALPFMQPSSLPVIPDQINDIDEAFPIEFSSQIQFPPPPPFPPFKTALNSDVATVPAFRGRAISSTGDLELDGRRGSLVAASYDTPFVAPTVTPSPFPSIPYTSTPHTSPYGRYNPSPSVVFTPSSVLNVVTPSSETNYHTPLGDINGISQRETDEMSLEFIEALLFPPEEDTSMGPGVPPSWHFTDGQFISR